MLEMRLNNEKDIDVKSIIALISKDLEREAEYFIVKARALELLIKVSDYDAVNQEQGAAQTLINGVLALYQGLENQQSTDLNLQMKCIDYLKNFYNDHQFKTNEHAPMLTSFDSSPNHLQQPHPEVRTLWRRTSELSDHQRGPGIVPIHC